MPGHFYYGDNLSVLRQHIADNSVDLIYLAPPFKSDATYNMPFSGPDGVSPAESPVRAFGFDRCLVVGVKPERLGALRAGLLDLRTLLLESPRRRMVHHHLRRHD